MTSVVNNNASHQYTNGMIMSDIVRQQLTLAE